MGREIRRVPLDFEWPLDKIWDGFLNPHYEHRRDCPFCEGSCYNTQTKQIADDFYDFAKTGRRWCSEITQDEVDALIAANRLWDFWREIVPGKGWRDKNPIPEVTAEQVNAWNEHCFGHDGINRLILIRARAERLGVYGHCEHCDGSGDLWRTPEDKAACEAWEKTSPPEGPGWQVWETVSEGSPISPVFATKGDLVEWLVGEGYSPEAAAGFADSGWVMSGLMCNGKFHKNIEACAPGICDDEGGRDL